MPALERTVPLPEVADIAEAVGDDLQLDVARPLEVTLHVDGVVAEGGLGLRPGGRDRLGEVLLGPCDLHAPSTAAGRGLDQDREADFPGRGEGLFLGRDGAIGPGHHRDPGFPHRLLGGDLVAHHGDVLGKRANEGEAVGVHDLGEARILGQESIPGMDGLGAGDLGGGDDGRDVEVAL